MKQFPSISEAEYEVMKVIWQHAPISTNQVVEALTKTTEWSPKTIQSMLSRLVKKGILDYQKQSRVYVYTPLVEEKDYVALESAHFLKRFYNGTIQSMLLNFVQDEKLSKDEIAHLKTLLEEQLREGGQR